MKTARAPRAAASITGREAGEAISSSEVNRPTSGSGAPPARAKASSTKAFMTRPAFMSETPGPNAEMALDAERARRRGARGEHGVAMAEQQHVVIGVAGRRHRGLEEEAGGGVRRLTSQATPRASRWACNVLPARSTPALSSEPESVSTSSPSSWTMGSYCVSSQASTSASRAAIGMGVLLRAIAGLSCINAFA